MEKLETTLIIRAPSQAADRKPYTAPRLVVHGSVAQLTAAGGTNAGLGVSVIDGPDG